MSDGITESRRGTYFSGKKKMPLWKITNNNFKVLKWDRESAIYIPITIEL